MSLIRWRAAIAVTLVGLLAGCGGAGATTEETAPRASTSPVASGSPEPGKSYNASDVMFAQMMVPHHGQGIKIVGLAADRATTPGVKTLAAAIETTQTAEVTTISGWLRTWGKPATAPADEHTAHGGMPGTTEGEIATVRRKTGKDFDRAFLNMLIAHQDDAIQLARLEAATGYHAEVRKLATLIDKSRSAQIAQMLELLKKV